MKLIVLVALLVLLLFVQVSIDFPRWGFIAVRPDFLLLLVLSWGLVFGTTQAVVAGAVAGVLLDTMSAAPFGTHLAALAVVALLTTLRHLELMDTAAAYILVLTPLATLAYYGSVALLFTVSARPVDWSAGIIGVVFPALVINALLSPVIYVLVLNLADRMTRRTPSRLV